MTSFLKDDGWLINDQLQKKTFWNIFFFLIPYRRVCRNLRDVITYRLTCRQPEISAIYELFGRNTMLATGL
jgi:hypothetical protein